MLGNIAIMLNHHNELSGLHMFHRLLLRLFRSPKQTNFVSELDTFMTHVRAKTPLSASQQQEIAKATIIANKRDHKANKDSVELWSQF